MAEDSPTAAPESAYVDKEKTEVEWLGKMQGVFVEMPLVELYLVKKTGV